MGDVAALTLPMTRIDSIAGPPIFRPVSSGLPVKRRLFGPVDHARVSETLQRQRRKIQDEDRARWNFDFVAERPLEPGRYVWQKVDHNGRCPGEEDRDGGSSERRDDDASNDAGEGSGRRGQRQTQITDFMRKRKHSASSEKRDGTSLSKVRRRSST